MAQKDDEVSNSYARRFNGVVPRMELQLDLQQFDTV